MKCKKTLGAAGTPPHPDWEACSALTDPYLVGKSTPLSALQASLAPPTNFTPGYASLVMTTFSLILQTIMTNRMNWTEIIFSALGGAGTPLSAYTVFLTRRSDVAYTLQPCHETSRAARVDETTEKWPWEGTAWTCWHRRNQGVQVPPPQGDK